MKDLSIIRNHSLVLVASPVREKPAMKTGDTHLFPALAASTVGSSEVKIRQPGWRMLRGVPEQGAPLTRLDAGENGLQGLRGRGGHSSHPTLFSRPSGARAGTHPPRFSTAEAVQRCRDGSRIAASRLPGKQGLGV